MDALIVAAIVLALLGLGVIAWSMVMIAIDHRERTRARRIEKPHLWEEPEEGA